MKAPGFWDNDSLLATVLSPLSLGMRAGGWVRRMATTPYAAPVPVICVGNLVAGGAGKTPVAIALGRQLRAKGKAVHFLSRGYGGREAGPLQVDPDRHTAADVGDEPLLLARSAPSWIARNRAAGAAAAVAAGAQAIVMDDGFQNPTLEKDLSILIVDGTYGFGNGRVMPAGPLREPLAAGLGRADAVVLMEPDMAGVESMLPPSLPVLRAVLTPDAPDAISGRTVFAFAGIARPEKFFETLKNLGCTIAGQRAFPDHYRYSESDGAALVAAAASANAAPVTTEKDAVRLPPAIRQKVETLAVSLTWKDPTAIERLLTPYF